jgi:hypothetical protein
MKSSMVGLIFVWALIVQSDSTGPARPIWTSEVVSDLSGARNPGTPQLIDPSRAGLAYLDGDRLIVHETDLDGGLSSPASPDIQSAFRLHAVVLDTHSGRVVDTRDWPTRSRDSTILVSSGAVLVRCGEVLRFFSKKFDPIVDITLAAPYHGEAPSDIAEETISVSDTGNSIIVNAYNHKLRASNLMVLDGNTLRKKFFWTASPPVLHLYSSSDSQIATLDTTQKHLLVATFGTTDWKPFGGLDGKACRGPLASPVWVTEESIVLPACKELLLVPPTGPPLILDKFAYAERFTRKLQVSQNGRFVALVMDTVQTKHRPFKEDEEMIRSKTVFIYDLTQQKRILRVPVEPIPEVDFDFALSPDGSQLAVLNGRQVLMYLVSGN